MTAKTLRKEEGSGSTRILSSELSLVCRSDGPKLKRGRKKVSKIMKQMMILKELNAKWDAEEDARCAAEEELFGRLPDRVASNSTFEEESSGNIVAPGDSCCQISDNNFLDLSLMVVSLALFDGDKMVFACSGISLGHGTTKLGVTRFVTSARLVREFIDKRNREDELRIEVCLPDSTITDGFLDCMMKILLSSLHWAS